MIEKILEISNIGHFVNYRFQGSTKWNGEFRKLNVIYAPNGSGKTTLSTILKSLSLNNGDLIQFKRTFGSTDDPKVLLKEFGNSNLIKLESLTWTPNDLKIEVFDINYIEENLFAGSFVRKQTKTNLFKLLLGNQGIQYRNQIKTLIHKRERLSRQISHRPDDTSSEAELINCVNSLRNSVHEYESYSDSIFNLHIETVNKYLSKFSSYISLLEFSYLKNQNEFERFRIFPVFEVYDERVEFSAPDLTKGIGSARYAMSEGDKSTIALCFFLARLEIQGYSDKIIVFDDPLSSFDYSRRNATIFQLAKFATSAVQFFLLTHDLGFANDFVDKCSFIENITLKIENNSQTSFLSYHDIGAEFLTSTQKDIEVIRKYLNEGAKDDYDKREVIRCIRPVLEGVFKAKYFDIITNNVWLGDIIEKLKKAREGERLYKLRNIIDDVMELNDFTKSYHHSSGDSKNMIINSAELRRYVKTLMDVIDKV